MTNMMINKNQNTKTTSYSFDESNPDRLVTKELIDEIVEIGSMENNIVRLLLHKDHSALLQSMLIFLPEGAGYGLHMHPGKNECYQSLYGSVELETMSNDKMMHKKFILNSDNPIFYSTKGLWHALKAVGGYAVFVENREGSFDPNDKNETIWAKDRE
jgi:cupin fold WbuC family metalloprotein